MSKVKNERLISVLKTKTASAIADVMERMGHKGTGVGQDNGQDKRRILTVDYCMAECVDVVELPIKEMVSLMFKPQDGENCSHPFISLTLPKAMKSSAALGEFMFGMDFELAKAHCYEPLVIEDMEAFKKLVLGKKFGIEISENPATGWRYVTDFFNLVGTDKLPSCPKDIVRNEF